MRATSGSRAGRWLTGLLLLVVAGAIVTVLVVAHGGVADVAATSGHWAPVEWLLTAARDSALDRRAAEVLEAGVPDLDDPVRLARGAPLYREHCAFCHGAPGAERAAAGRGMNPPPPDLAGGPLSERQAARAFWILDHGLKMTGMPAFGRELERETLWDLVAVQHRLGEITPADYRRLAGPAAAADSRE